MPPFTRKYEIMNNVFISGYKISTRLAQRGEQHYPSSYGVVSDELLLLFTPLTVKDTRLRADE